MESPKDIKSRYEAALGKLILQHQEIRACLWQVNCMIVAQCTTPWVYKDEVAHDWVVHDRHNPKKFIDDPVKRSSLLEKYFSHRYLQLQHIRSMESGSNKSLIEEFHFNLSVIFDGLLKFGAPFTQLTEAFGKNGKYTGVDLLDMPFTSENKIRNGFVHAYFHFAEWSENKSIIHIRRDKAGDYNNHHTDKKGRPKIGKLDFGDKDTLYIGHQVSINDLEQHLVNQERTIHVLAHAFQETHFAYFLNAPKTSESLIETWDTFFNEIIELKSIEQDMRRFYHLVFQDKLEININATSPDGLFPPEPADIDEYGLDFD